MALAQVLVSSSCFFTPSLVLFSFDIVCSPKKKYRHQNAPHCTRAAAHSRFSRALPDVQCLTRTVVVQCGAAGIFMDPLLLLTTTAVTALTNPTNQDSQGLHKHLDETLINPWKPGGLELPAVDSTLSRPFSKQSLASCASRPPAAPLDDDDNHYMIDDDFPLLFRVGDPYPALVVLREAKLTRGVTRGFFCINLMNVRKLLEGM